MSRVLSLLRYDRDNSETSRIKFVLRAFIAVVNVSYLFKKAI